MTTTLGMEVRLDLPFAHAVARTRETLKTEGFGVLTEIDMQAAFMEKLGRAFRPYVILGACNPLLAHSALSGDPEVGLLLPCNVTVEAAPDGSSIVRLVDPERLLTSAVRAGSPTLHDVARDARERLQRVAQALTVVVEDTRGSCDQQREPLRCRGRREWRRPPSPGGSG